VAEGLAGAFLAGEWEPPAMALRGARALRDRRRWVLDVAAIAHAAYPVRPADRPRELAALLAECGPLVEAVAVALTDPERPPKVHTWMAAPTEMRRDGAEQQRAVAIPDLGSLARWLGASPAHLDWFADRRSMERTVTDERLRHYHRRWVTKADGSGRLLEAPKRELKDLQRQVLHGILDDVLDGAHGSRRSRSVHSAARPHAGKAVVVRLDLESFFGSVTAGWVYAAFRHAGYPEPVAHTLTGLCTTVTPLAARRLAPRPPAADAVERHRRMLADLARPHLPQGAPTSPALADLAALRFDRRVGALARRFGADYTRYADDLAISGDRRLLGRVDRLVGLVGDIARDEGFRLHGGKTGVRTASQRQRVAGLVVNGSPQVPRADYDRLRAVLHDAARSGPAAANRAGHPDFRAHLLGRIAWVGAGNPARDAKLRRAFAAIDWP
jgi:hypothetical protein